MRILRTRTPDLLEEIRKPPNIEIDFSKVETSSSPDGFPGRYEFTAVYNGKTIGRIEYFIRNHTNSLVVSVIATNQDYWGQELGLWMYKKLIEFAKNKGLKYFTSDSVVQGGSLVSWRKLDKDTQLDVRVSSGCADDYKEFVDTYDSGKIFKRTISDTKGFVFKIVL